MKKYRGWIVALLIAVLLAVAIVPLVINWLFKQVAPWEFMVAEWEASDALSYWGTILSFGGALALGAVTVYQTKKAHEQTEKANDLAAQMQKFEQAKFVSMVSVETRFHSEYERPSYQLEQARPSAIDEFIDLKHEEADSARSYYVDVDVRNDSDYPIVQVEIHPGARGNNNAVLYGLVDYKVLAVYIPPRDQIKVRITIPSDRLRSARITDVSLSIDFTNIFDYTTVARLDLQNLGVAGRRPCTTYRLAKFTDIRPCTE